VSLRSSFIFESTQLADSRSSVSIPNLSQLAKEPVIIEGEGIHTGRSFRVHFKRGPLGSGVIFRVEANKVSCSAPALWTRISGTSRFTALVLRGDHGQKVELRTIEHLLAALWCLGTPDLEICVTPLNESDISSVFEIPILDGSSESWIHFFSHHPSLFSSAPLADEERKMACWKVERDFELLDGSKAIRFAPLDGAITQLMSSVDFGGQLQQTASFVADWRLGTFSVLKDFAEQIAAARTFGFRAELEDLARRGLAKGGTLKNAILIDGDQVVNPEGFRMKDELARHKILDAIGDFALLGAPIFGSIQLVRAGHSMHLYAVKEAVDKGVLQRGHMHLDSGLFLPDSL